MRHDVIKTYGTVDAKLHSFLPSAPDGGEWSAWRCCHFTRGENAPGTQCIGDWVIPKGSLDAAKEKYLALSGKKFGGLVIIPPELPWLFKVIKIRIKNTSRISRQDLRVLLQELLQSLNFL
jgi:hypothetical protein